MRGFPAVIPAGSVSSPLTLILALVCSPLSPPDDPTVEMRAGLILYWRTRIFSHDEIFSFQLLDPRKDDADSGSCHTESSRKRTRTRSNTYEYSYVPIIGSSPDRITGFLHGRLRLDRPRLRPPLRPRARPFGRKVTRSGTSTSAALTYTVRVQCRYSTCYIEYCTCTRVHVSVRRPYSIIMILYSDTRPPPTASGNGQRQIRSCGTSPLVCVANLSGR